MLFTNGQYFAAEFRPQFFHLENRNVGIMVMMFISMNVMCDHGDDLVGNIIYNQIVRTHRPKNIFLTTNIY